MCMLIIGQLCILHMRDKNFFNDAFGWMCNDADPGGSSWDAFKIFVDV